LRQSAESSKENYPDEPISPAYISSILSTNLPEPTPKGMSKAMYNSKAKDKNLADAHDDYFPPLSFLII
jgi:hypothetical protein